MTNLTTECVKVLFACCVWREEENEMYNEQPVPVTNPG